MDYVLSRFALTMEHSDNICKKAYYKSKIKPVSETKDTLCRDPCDASEVLCKATEPGWEEHWLFSFLDFFFFNIFPRAFR